MPSFSIPFYVLFDKYMHMHYVSKNSQLMTAAVYKEEEYEEEL